ncbi:hypothetical protein E1287_22530 [Actinomadura sp. KC06]|uniref:hypothetical protein n=1 Tax=Actinomadura sp. KC06 TaxID=2530369 RepID=UPI001050EA13|nr:hypothetical protein [Actinomadura sp. KC06]TDD32467.1 hypothetical protein E1287_22530 [Actinomadura sp. KC06]
MKCRKVKPHHARGECLGCYRKRYPKCDAPIGNPGGKGQSRDPGAVASRVEDYAFVRSDRSVSRAEAAARVGISYRTAMRYDQRLNETSNA